MAEEEIGSGNQPAEPVAELGFRKIPFDKEVIKEVCEYFDKIEGAIELYEKIIEKAILSFPGLDWDKLGKKLMGQILAVEEYEGQEVPSKEQIASHISSNITDDFHQHLCMLVDLNRKEGV